MWRKERFKFLDSITNSLVDSGGNNRETSADLRQAKSGDANLRAFGSGGHQLKNLRYQFACVPAERRGFRMRAAVSFNESLGQSHQATGFVPPTLASRDQLSR